jgi:hypothetical protein
LRGLSLDSTPGAATAVAILTGHGLKDSGAVDQSNAVEVDASLATILEALS